MDMKNLVIIFAIISVIAAKRNVLFIVVDDLRPSLGCYRDPNAFTPNIDQLASRSIVFQNAFAQQALCAPSRNSFLTSRRPDTLKLYDFYSYWRTFAGNFTTLPQYFKENGYLTKSIGKVFHPGISSNNTDDELYSWSEKPFHAKTEKYKDANVCYSKDDPDIPYDNIVCPVDVDQQPGGTLPDIEISNEAIAFLKSRNDSKPFFLAVGFHKPHIPLKYPYKYLKYHPLENVTIPSNKEKPEGLPDVAWNPWNDLRRRDDIKKLHLTFPFQPMPEHKTKLIIQSYYAAVTYIDDMIGKVIKSLSNEETIVALIGDHGWSLGEHGEWSKFSNYEMALRVPFIVHSSGFKHRKIKNLVELVDLFPTLADLAGLKSLEQCPVCSKDIQLCTQGKSLLPLMQGKKHQTRDFKIALSQYPRPGTYPERNPDSDRPRLKDIKIMGHSLRTTRFRYTQWFNFSHSTKWNETVALEIYDHWFDPEENINLTNSTKYAKQKLYLSKTLIEENSKYKFC